VVEASRELGPVLLVGAPLRRNGRLYNCALAISRGVVLGVVPKTFLPNYREYYEKRWFAPGVGLRELEIAVAGQQVPFGADLIFAAEDWPTSSSRRDLRGLLGAAAASTVGGAVGRADPVQPVGLQHHHRQGGRAQIALRLAKLTMLRAYVYAASGPGESTTDLAWDGQGSIYEFGEILAESGRFDP
jgi:NAD+ synthase (glutamine-hydrolysing)